MEVTTVLQKKLPYYIGQEAVILHWTDYVTECSGTCANRRHSTADTSTPHMAGKKREESDKLSF